MPVPQTKISLANALATGRALRFLPNAAGDFGLSVTGRPAAPWLSVIADLDGDGRPDFVFGAPGDDDKAVDAGRIVVSLDAFAFGTTNGVTDGLNRIIIDGVNAGDRAGAAVGTIGDLNGDGIAEILVGAPGMENGALLDAGAAFVVWGSSVAAGVDLDTPFNGDGDGFAIKGQAAGDAAGTTILSIADLNGDGLADILVGAPGNDAGGSNAGAAYVVWGKSTDTIVSLASVAAGTGGFKIIGEDSNDAAGSVLGTVADLNGDGKAEILIGTPDSALGGANSGAVFVVFGKASGTAVDLTNVAAGVGGFVIKGAAQDDAGAAVSGLGDINGDGKADILVGAPRSDSAYVVFGKADTAAVDLAAVALGTGGFRILAETTGDLDSLSIAGGGDLNGDGISDLVIGAANNSEGGSDAGAVYVVWGGGSKTIDLALVAQGVGGAKIVGSAGSLTGSSVVVTGDLNGDGRADLMIGAPGTGESAYVLYAATSWLADNNIYGTAGNDSIGVGYGDRVKVGDTADAILGLAGNDSIHGAGGNDSIEGGAGNDALFGDAGNDTLDGGTGNDALDGGAGDDTYFVDSTLDSAAELTGDGIDTVFASVNFTLGAGIENLTLTVAGRTGTGNADANTLTGTAGSDTLDGGAGADTLAGGLGNDSYRVDDVGDNVVEALGGGIDTVTASLDHVLGANVENLVLSGTARVGTGNSLNNSLTGTGFADTLDGGAGIDTLSGGLGDDRYLVDSTTDTIVEAAGAGTDTAVASVAVVLAANVENLVLVGAARAGTGNTLANAMTGTIGSDTLDGGAGIDTLAGGLGDDTYKVDNVGDVIVEAVGEGTDTVLAAFDYSLGATEIENLTLNGAAHVGTGNAGNNIITGGTGNDTLNGGDGIDTLVGGAGNDRYLVDTATDTITELAGGGIDVIVASIDYTLATAEVENLELSGAARVGTGNAAANSITGTTGDDTLDGGAGTDTLAGGLGDDSYRVDSSADIVVEAASAGNDSVVASANYTLSAEIEALALTGAARFGTGNAAANTITGTIGNDTLDGGAGIDTLTGGLGDDSYKVDNAADVIVEADGEGTDTVIASFDYTLGAGSIENLTLADAAHVGTGNAGNNVISGGTGDDTLNGGDGVDILAGGSGNDSYLVDTTTDTITELAGGGIDTVLASVDFALGAEVENLVLTGGAHVGTGNVLDNRLVGGIGADTLAGDLGNDSLDGGAGADLLSGGAGDDTYFIDNVGDVVVETAGGGSDTVVVSSDWTLADNIENVRLSGSGHALTGNAANNKLEGDTGDDELDGGEGDDIELGGDGNDRLISRSGRDTLAGGAGDDVYVLGGGAAHIEDFLGHDTVDASEAEGDSHIDLSGDTATEVEGQICDFGTGGTVTGTLNVQFLQDLTGSFGDDIANVRTLVPQIVTALQTVQSNAAFGVSTFRDKAIGSFGSAGDWVYLTQNAIGTTPAALTAAYNAMVAGGGADLPESQLEALMQLGLRAGGEVGFQSNAARFVVLFTDASFHIAGDGAAAGILTPNNGDAILDGNGIGEDYPMIAQVEAALVAANIIPIFAVTAGLETTYQGLVTALDRGTVVTLSANSSNIVAAITAGLTTATTTHIATAIGGAGNDTLIGNVGDNMLVGNAGNDSFTGSDGDDSIDGGIGSDTAVFSGTRADYVITFLSPTSIVVDDLRAIDDTDTVTNVEFLRFSDVTIATDGSTPTNSAPTAATLATSVVAENAASATVVGTVVGSDPDAGDVLSYALVNDAGGRFVIDGATGVLSVASGAVLDFEAAASHAISVKVTDAAGASSSFGFTIAVSNVNDLAPVFTSAAAMSLAENGTAVGTVTAVDPDGLASPAFAITGGADAALFNIDAVTGALSFIASPDFETPIDAGADNAYDVSVTASDGSLTAVQAITIAVTNANDLAPVFTSATALSLAENATAAGTVTAVDPDGLASPVYSITGGVDAALFTINAATGALSFIAAPDFETPLDAGADNVYDVAVTASDGGLTAAQAIAVTVTDVAEAPTQSFTGTALADVFTVADGNGWTLSGLAGNDTLIGGALADVIIGGRGNDVLAGGGGADVFKVAAGDGSDRYDGGTGVDRIIATTANAVIGIAALAGIEAIDAGGFANVSLAGTTAADTFDFSGITLTGITKIDAGGGADTVTGSAGGDTLVLGAGNDVFHAGEGDDIFLAKASTGIDIIDGGGGSDTILATAANFTLVVTAISGIEMIDAGGFAGVKLAGSTAADVIDFSATNLLGITSISGLGGNDTLVGSVAADRLIGGTGRDVLTGGDGADSFVFNSTGESGVGVTKADHITDFLSGTDIIDLSGIDAIASLAGNQAFAFIGDAAFTALGQLRLGIDSDGHVALFGNTSGNLNADFQLSFDNNALLAATDIFL